MNIPAALIEQFAEAKCVVALTGAGVSAESGVPTFRDAQTGLWAKYNPEELATPRGFLRNPGLVWKWYEWRRNLVAAAQPNPAHFALATLATLVPQFRLITQNVDGLHQRAGSPRVIELHGNITRTKCFDEDALVSKWDETIEVPPRCPRCGGWLRPDVVWFGEPLPEVELAEAFRVSSRCELFLSVGTSGLVYPAALLPYEAIEHGATVVEINPQPSRLASQAHYVLTGAAGVVVPELLAALRNAKASPG